MTDIIRVKAPITELMIVVIAMITSVVYGAQRTHPSGVVAWYNSPLMLFVGACVIVLGYVLAYTSQKRPSVFVQYLSGAIALSLLYPAVISSVTVARQDSSKDGGVYTTVQSVLLTLAVIVIAVNLYAVIGTGAGSVSPQISGAIVMYTMPIAISVLLFSASILVST